MSFGANILVVDDDKLLRATLSKILETHGYHVREASDGEEALELLKKQQFDIVLLDEYMPGRRGLEVLHEAKRTGCKSAFIMITGKYHDEIELVVEAIKSGAKDFLKKPLLPKQLLEVIEKYRPRSEAALEGDLVVSYIQQHCHQLHGREEVAQALCLSPKTVSRHLVKAKNQDFSEFLNRCRLEKAKFLLETTELDISQIAHKVGFCSPSHFSRIFRQFIQMTPTQYRLAKKVGYF